MGRCAMGLHARIWFTAAQKAGLWERWNDGQSAAAISLSLHRRNKTGVERIVVLHGGIAPAPRRRALAALGLRNAKRFPVALRRTGRSGGSPRASDGRHQQSVGRSGATAAFRAIVQTMPIG